MKIKFTNNAASNITTAIDTSSTSLEVTSGTGALFPALSSDEYFYATLVGQDAMEIVKVTARDGDTFTITRGQDNTTAQSFSVGDVIELRITAAAFNGIAEELTDVADTCVRLTGDQSITGEKTFVASPTIAQPYPYLKLQFNNIDSNVTDSVCHHSGINVYDKTGFADIDIMGGLRVFRDPSGAIITGIFAHTPDPSYDYSESIQVIYRDNGGVHTYCPKPEANSNTYNIATTAWVRERNTISTSTPSGGTAGDTWLQYIA